MISYQTVFIAAVIGVIPVVLWMWFIIKRNHLTYESSNWLLKVFFWGVLTAVPAIVIELLISETDGTSQVISMMRQVWSYQEGAWVSVLFISTLLVALIEEVSKGIGILVAIKSRKITRYTQGIMHGMIIGLAFAVTENGVYFASVLASGSAQSGLLSIILLRFLLSTSAHIIYSGLMGSFLTQGYLARSNGKKIIFYILALVVPVMIHLIFNLIVTTDYGFLVLPVIVMGFGMLWLSYRMGEKKDDENTHQQEKRLFNET